jgi:hypothetical protein
VNEDSDLVRVAARLASVLRREGCMVVGGIAVGAHGYVCATDDVDVVVNGSLAEARRALEAAGIRAQLRRGDALEGDFPCVKGVLDGVPFDVLPALVSLEWENAIEIATASGTLPIVDLGGLLRLKLRAQGAQDLLDVAVLVLRNPEHRQEAREIAAAYRVLDRLDAFLADRRTQATAAEQKAREEKTARGGTRGPRRPRRPRGIR